MSVCALIMLILQNLQCNLHFAWGQGCYLGVQLYSFFKVDAQTEKERAGGVNDAILTPCQHDPYSYFH